MAFKTVKTLYYHLAATQYFRWYQVYERDQSPARIANAMAILSDDVVIKSQAGETKGKVGYPNRLAAYKGWQNAHHVQNFVVNETSDGQLNLEADIRYQNIRPDGQKFNYALHYSTLLQKNGLDLPLFTRLELKPTGETQDVFSDAYPTNRTKSLMHYWLATMERLDGIVAPYAAVLADGFVLNFTSAGIIESLPALEKWLQAIPMTMAETNHHPENFALKVIDEHHWELQVEFDWYGTTKAGQRLTMRTHHHWQVENNPDDAFAKIKTMNVRTLESMHPAVE